MTEQRSLKQEYNGQTLDHVIVHDGTGRVLPTVIIIPTVMGVQPLEIGFAEKLVALGYHVVVADLFGRRFTPGVDKEAAFAAMGELRADRAALRDRLLAMLARGSGAASMWTRSGSPSSAIASAGNARWTWRGRAPTSPASRPSTACSIRPGLRPSRSRPRSPPIMAGTTRWSRPKRSSRLARS